MRVSARRGSGACLGPRRTGLNPATQGRYLGGCQWGFATGLGRHDQIRVGGGDPLDDGASIRIMWHQAPRTAPSPGQGALEAGQLQPTGGLDVTVAGHALGIENRLNLPGEVRGLGGGSLDLTRRPRGQQACTGKREGCQRKESATERTGFSHDCLIMVEVCHFLPQSRRTANGYRRVGWGVVRVTIFCALGRIPVPQAKPDP